MNARSGNAAIASAKLLRGAAEPRNSAGLPGHRIRARAQALELAEREGLVAAAWRWAIVPLDASPAETLRAGGETFHAPWLLPKSGELTALAFAVCTIGPALERRVSGLFIERRPSLALALDILGNELLLTLSRRMQDLLLVEVKRRGLSMAGELRPGDPGLGLEAQAAVLRLAKAEEIGLAVTRLGMLNPTKSASAMFGVGVDLPPARWSRCDRCPSRKTCKVAKQDAVLAPAAGSPDPSLRAERSNPGAASAAAISGSPRRVPRLAMTALRAAPSIGAR